MKAILISIRPEWVAKILNGEKTIEVRKKFPKDYVGWVYIYCTKGGQNLFKKWNGHGDTYYCSNEPIGRCIWYKGNGKVVGRFWCDKVENVLNVGSDYGCFLKSESIRHNMEAVYSFYKRCCIEWEDFTKRFIDKNNRHKPLFAIHITKLEIFDEPKELYDLKTPKPFVYTNGTKGTIYYPLTYAPQNWQYIKV